MSSDTERVDYVQRRMPDPGTQRAEDTVGNAADALHSLLFHPIAGDGSGRAAGDVSVPLTSLRSVQFGILDAQTIQDIAVVTVTNPVTTDATGGLGDLRAALRPIGRGALRMGAVMGRSQPCQTCGNLHHDRAHGHTAP